MSTVACALESTYTITLCVCLGFSSFFVVEFFVGVFKMREREREEEREQNKREEEIVREDWELQKTN